MDEYEIFMRCPEGGSAEGRARYLDAACGGDAGLRARVESLFAAADRAGESFMEPVAVPVEPDDRTVASPAARGVAGLEWQQEREQIGNYKLLKKIGEGGFGTVYLAQQLEPVKRRVALKIVKLGMDTKEFVARFEAERQALALMDHPNIAAVYDAGATESGRPYFVMELVRGETITHYCDSEGLDTVARLKLFCDVCQAVQHAHHKGVIHRDIKPSNVLVTVRDDRALVKVIDFGVAKATQQDLTDKTLFTAVDQFIGTPAYMSPEQAKLSGLDIDTRSDVYSLGVLLYELLTGRTPFDSKALVRAGIDEIRRVIREEEPPKPSTRLSALGEVELTELAKRRHAEAGKLSALVRGELDWIVMKALEKDRTRRYETATGFAQDIGRYLDGEPVLAAAAGVSYRLGKFLRKHRRAVAVAAAIALLLVGGVFGITWFAIEANRQRRLAEERTDEAQFNEGLGWLLRAAVADDRGHRYPDTLFYAARAIGFDALGRPAAEVSGLPRLIREERDPQRYRQAREWIRARPSYLPVWSSSASIAGVPVTGVALSPEGRRLATSAADGSVRLWDFASGGQPVEVVPATGGAVTGLTFHPDGERLVVVLGRELKYWHAEKSSFVATEPGAVSAIAFSPDGSFVARAQASGAISVSGGGGQITFETDRSEPASALAFSPDDAVLAARYPGGALRLFFHHAAVAHRSWEERGDNMEVTAFAFGPDGAKLAIGSADGGVSVWDVGGAQLLGEAPELQHHGGAVSDLSFAHGGTHLASASLDGLIKLWKLEGDQPTIVATLNGHVAGSSRVAQFAGGELLASAGADGRVRLWDVSGRRGIDLPIYQYLEQNWFQVGTEEVAAGAGEGFLNVREGSLLGLWLDSQRDAGDLFDRLIATGQWAGANLVVQPGNREALAAPLLSDAEDAARQNRWNSVRLRLRQLQGLGVADTGARIDALRQRLPATPGNHFTNGEGIELVWCPPGAFTMGSPDDAWEHRDYENQHEVTLSSGFWIGKYELSQAQYEAVMGRNTDHQSAPPDAPQQIRDRWRELAPAENMDWPSAMAFCRRLTERERARGAVPPGWEYSLPSEAQWEYACRAGTPDADPFYFGDNPAEFHQYGNFDDVRGQFKLPDLTQDDGFKYSAPIGSYQANPWGIHDMHGNVWEWCLDAIVGLDVVEDTPPYPGGPTTDPLGQDGRFRVYRGGGFTSYPGHARSAYRRRNNPADRDPDLGMRPVLTRVRPD